MSAKAMYDLRETLCADLDQYAKKGNLTRTELDTVHMMTDTIKNLDKITAMEEQGNSYGEGNWNANGSYSNGMMYDGRTSGRRGGHDGGNYSGTRYMRDGYSNDGYDIENRMRREMNY